MHRRDALPLGGTLSRVEILDGGGVPLQCNNSQYRNKRLSRQTWTSLSSAFCMVMPPQTYRIGPRAAIPESAEGESRQNQRMSMRDLEVLSSIDPITTTSTGDSE